MRKSTRKTLKQELAKVRREGEYLWLYVQDRERQQKPSASVTLSNAETAHGDVFYEAHWYQADRSDKGYVAVIHHYGPRRNQRIVYVMPWADLRAIKHDRDIVVIRHKLELARTRLNCIPASVNI